VLSASVTQSRVSSAGAQGIAMVTDSRRIREGLSENPG
jgi:hypothetical protein